MQPSPSQQIEQIVRSLEQKGQAAAPVEEAIELATSHPESVSDLARAVMQRFPKGGTFLDAVLSYLPFAEWPLLVQSALDAYETALGKNEAAESVIAYASLQAPSALHPHLCRLFLLQPNSGTYYESYPWRESGELDFEHLRSIVKNDNAHQDIRRRAWSKLFETRHPKVIEYAIACVTEADDLISAGWSKTDWLQAHLHPVGFQLANEALQSLCPNALYHLQFPASFLADPSRPPWLRRVHPTWQLSPIQQTIGLGGRSQNSCAVCGEGLHRLLVFASIPAGVEITKLSRIEFATCLSCLGWERQPLFYQHDQEGTPVNIACDGAMVTPQFPSCPLQVMDVQLAATPRRWFWQDWALSNSRENLNRIGGEPCWVQDAEYPDCPACQQKMAFLFQLDSDLLTETGGEWLWGSGGIGYGFWCDHCKVSGFLWQCT